MHLHQEPKYEWNSKAIQLTESVPNIAITRPRCGPPHPEGKAFHPNPFTEDERGFLAHKFFSMRAYLIHRDRFAQLSPIPLMWKHRPLFSRYLPEPLQTISAKLERRLRGQKGSVKGAIASFEPMTSKKLEMSDYIRADLTSTQAWTIHPAKHGADFIKALPDLINSIEQGKYPIAQAGYYDLILEEWIELIESSHD